MSKLVTFFESRGNRERQPLDDPAVHVPKGVSAHKGATRQEPADS